MSISYPEHPLGTQANILLTSVFGPYAQDDEYGSREINPMELYHNQVTRVQGPFSLRMFHRSLGLMLLQENIDAPCTVLDFPTLERFVAELRSQPYDIVGISSIVHNLGKVRMMCELIRAHQPNATIVVGGHVASQPDLDRMIDVDHICRGDGVRWLRRFLGQDEDAPVKHPLVASGFGARALGLPIPDKHTAAVLIPSVGCPVGCDFCSTSALFGGKGKFINFYESGDDLFDAIARLEEKLKVRAFFVLDENFLLHRRRALRLLELMERHHKSWTFYVFSSARVLKSYTIEQLIGLGIAWAWLGLEGEGSQYGKLSGVDTQWLVRHLQSHGICVLGSTIIGLADHTPENIDQVVDWAVSHNTDFHQFMLYTPLPGTPLHEQHSREGRLLPDDLCDVADAHGQYRFNYRHEHIRDGKETGYLLGAFQQDFEVNGPSLARMIRTTLTGWKRYRNHPDLRIRDRFRDRVGSLAVVYAAAIWAMRKWYRRDHAMREKLDAILRDMHAEMGLITRTTAPLFGRWMYGAAKREARRLDNGWKYEPPAFYEKNAKALELEKNGKSRLSSSASARSACTPGQTGERQQSAVSHQQSGKAETRRRTRAKV